MSTGSHDERYLQERIALFTKSWTLVMLFGVCLRAVVVFVAPGDGTELFNEPFFVQMACVPAVAIPWWIARGAPRTVLTLRLAEAFALNASAACFGVMGAGISVKILEAERQANAAVDIHQGVLAFMMVITHQYASLIVIFVVTAMVILRAALVPSTGLRTFGLSMSLGVVLLVAYAVRARGLAVPGATVVIITGAFAFWMLTVSVATVLSHVIHGLRQQVRSAQRLGQYTLETKLGEGGMGMVYKASHALLRRPTAVKLLLPDKVGEKALARFEREVQLTAQLTHPNTVTVFDYGHTPDGVFYYAMELLDGLDLEQLVEVGGPQPPERVAHILAQACGALGEAHELGLIHRDIKPANILLVERGGWHDVAKVVDFGLVKDVRSDQDDAQPGVTQDGALTGTPMYLPPEALKDPDAVDGRSDLYALGAVAYYLLVGEPVFNGKTIVEICGHHLHTEPTPPSERVDGVPSELEALVLACLAKEPTARPASAKALRKALVALELAPWTEGDAEAWWTEHEAAIEALASEEQKATTTGLTVAVDLAARAAS